MAIYFVARYAGVKAKELRARFGSMDGLPDVDTARKFIDQTDQAKTSARNAFSNDSHKLKAKAELNGLEKQRLAING